MKKVLIYGAYGRDNLGDDYMMYHVNQILKKENIVPYFYYHGNEYYFNNITSLSKQYICPLNKRYSNKVTKLFEIIKWYFKQEDFFALIFMGGGYTNEEFGIIKLLKIKLLCLKNRKNGIYFTGQTVGPALSTFGKILINSIYKSADIIYTREKYSYNYLKANGIDNKLVGDDAFLGYSPEKEKENLTIVTYKDYYGYEEYKAFFFNAVISYAQKCREKILVIPFMSSNKSKEYRINYELYEELQKRGIECEFIIEKDISKFENIFKVSKNVISSAYHAITIGQMFGCKTVGVFMGDYYRSKIEGILDLYGQKNIQAVEMSSIKMNQNIFFKTLGLVESISNQVKISKGISAAVKKEWKFIAEIINGKIENN